MKTKKLLIIAITSFLFVSCSNDSDSDITPDPDPNPGTITYTNTIKSIMDSNCISCHGSVPNNGAAVSLNTYQKVKNAILDNGLIDRISKLQSDPGLMPKNGTRLPQSSIDIITNWKNNGYLE